MNYDDLKIDIDIPFLKNIRNDIYLNDNEVITLQKFNINVNNINSMSELLFIIEDIINNNYDKTDFEELDILSKNLSERNYYNNTFK